jgi:hypothetical protein
MRFIPMMFAAVLVVPVLSAAQAADPVPDWPLTPGLRVRVLSPALGWRPKTGNVVSATSDTLVFLPSKQAASTAIGTPKISRIEVVQGKRTHKLQGALLGLFVGAGVGAIWASASYKPPKCAPGVWCMDLFGQSGDAAAGGILGGLLGMITGIIVGNRETDNWVPVAVPAPTVAVK